MRERVDEIAVGVCLEALQGHGTTGGRADELCQLIPPMRRNGRVGVEGKPVDTRTARPGEPWRLALRAKARADAAHLLAGAFTTSDAVLDRRRHGPSKRGLVVAQRIILGGHRGVQTRVQIAQPTQLTDDPATDFLEDRGDIAIGRRLTREKAGLQASGGAIEVDALKKEDMEMEMYIQ